jgi:signal transduction histidine kinase
MTERLPLREILEEAIQFNAASCERHRIRIVRKYGEFLLADVDRHKLLQIIINLITNAIHAVKDQAESKSEITVSIATTLDEKWVAVEVTDNGCGIAPENLSNIFTHGFTTRKEGHGFGLHGSACNAMEMGGKLTARSDGIGKGAAFTLLLPLVQEEMAS